MFTISDQNRCFFLSASAYFFHASVENSHFFCALAKLDGIINRKPKGNVSPIFPEADDEEEDDPYGEKEADMRLGKKRV